MTTPVPIASLPAVALPLTGAEIVPVVQNGITAQTTVGTISTTQPFTITVMTGPTRLPAQAISP